MTPVLSMAISKDTSEAPLAWNFRHIADELNVKHPLARNLVPSFEFILGKQK